ncbi:MAG: hypothetical protein ACPGSB_04805, partial [Opitutales bacterium]
METELFIRQIRSRLNRRVLVRAMLTALFAATILSVLYGIFYVFRGYEVPEKGYFWIMLPLCLLGLIYSFVRRVSQSQAARFSDENFHLKDILISSMHFKTLTKRQEAHDLTIRLSEDAINELDPKEVSLQFPRRIGLGALLGLCIMLILALLPPSDAV